jgi:hypothetical protein
MQFFLVIVELSWLFLGHAYKMFDELIVRRKVLLWL